ncbi:DUF1684 domain-containing protein [Psychromicrobium sp. YIM B11713]|uniref:DUF1684 domain-containing protein n=1 Tax=Psychromicrobium sp. YIM B11713 TaxID=3145233 RepID=UPI00374EBC7A
MNSSYSKALATADWRRQTFELYAQVRRLAAQDAREAHLYWITERNRLFREHAASALSPAVQDGFNGLVVADYDPAYRFQAELSESGRGTTLSVPTGTDGVVDFECLGTLRFSGPDRRGRQTGITGQTVQLGSDEGPDRSAPHQPAELALWRHLGYGGGLFLPFRDATSGRPGGSYGGGRYLLDSIKGAYLGEETAMDGDPARLILDFNFAYNPSCAYDERWACPLPGPANRLSIEIPVGELLAG